MINSKVNIWSPSIQYEKHDVVSRTVSGNSFYFYAKETSLNSPPEISPNEWTTDFEWRPSFDSDINAGSFVKSLEFGDLYEQRISNNFIEYSIRKSFYFQDRSDKETFAIYFYLSNTKGSTPFKIKNAPVGINDLFFLLLNLEIRFLSFNNNSIVVSLVSKGTR